MGGTIGSVVGSATILILFYRATQRARKRQGSEGRRWLIATVVLGVAWLVASAASLILVPIWLTRSLSGGREKDCAKEGAPACPHPWQVAICNASTDYAYKCFDKATPCANARLQPDKACGGEQCVPICNSGEVLDCNNRNCVPKINCPDPPAFDNDGLPVGGGPVSLYSAALNACVPYRQAGDREAAQALLDKACQNTACGPCSTAKTNFQGFDWDRGRCYSKDIKCDTKESDKEWRERYTFRDGDIPKCKAVARKRGDQWCENPTYAQVIAACERDAAEGCRWGWKATAADGSKRCRVSTPEACARLDGATWDKDKGECRRGGAVIEEDRVADGCRPDGENWLMVGNACVKGLGNARASLAAALLTSTDAKTPSVLVTPEYITFTLKVTLSESVQDPQNDKARSAQGVYYVIYRNDEAPAYGVSVNRMIDFVNDSNPTLMQIMHSRSLASERPFTAKDTWQVTVLRYDVASNVLIDVLVGSDVANDKLARLDLPTTTDSFKPDADDAKLLPQPRRDLAEAVVQKLAKDFWDRVRKQRDLKPGDGGGIPYHVPPVHNADEYAVVPCVGGGLCTADQLGAKMLVVLAWTLDGALAGNVRFSVHRRIVSDSTQPPASVVDFNTPDEWGVPQEGKNALRVAVKPGSTAEVLVYSLTDTLVPGANYVYYIAAFDRAYKGRNEAPPEKRSPELVIQVVPNAYSDALCLSIPDASAPTAPFHLLDKKSGMCMPAKDIPGAHDWYCLAGGAPENISTPPAQAKSIDANNLRLYKQSATACHKVQPSTWLVDASDNGAPLNPDTLFDGIKTGDCFAGKLVKRRLLCGVAYPGNNPVAVADLKQPEFLWHDRIQETSTNDKIAASDLVKHLDDVKLLTDEHKELKRFVVLPQDQSHPVDPTSFVRDELLQCPHPNYELLPPPTAPGMLDKLTEASGCTKNKCTDQNWTPTYFPPGTNFYGDVAGYESDIRWLPPDDTKLANLDGTCCSSKGRLKRNEDKSTSTLAACECNDGNKGQNCDVLTKYKPVMTNYWQRFARYPRENEDRVSGVGVMLINAPTPQYKCVPDPSGAYIDKQACEINAYKEGDPKVTTSDKKPLVTTTNTVPNNTGRTDGACKAWRFGDNCDQENTKPCSNCDWTLHPFPTACSKKVCEGRYGCETVHEGCDAPFKAYSYPAGEGKDDGWDCQCAVPGEGFGDYDTLEKPPELAGSYLPLGVTDLSFKDKQCYRAMNHSAGKMSDGAVFQFRVDANAVDDGHGKPGKFYGLSEKEADNACGRDWRNGTVLPRVDFAELRNLHGGSFAVS